MRFKTGFLNLSKQDLHFFTYLYMMNIKHLLSGSLIISSLFGGQSFAQISQGGLPRSFSYSDILTPVPINTYASPDWKAQLRKESETSDEARFSSALVGGLVSAADFAFPRSGSFTSLKEGGMIWRGMISIEDAPSIALYFDQFELPKGVRMFVYNENRKQVAGAFDAGNNDASGKFAIDVVQGAKVFVELNIDAAVDPEAIKLHMDKAVVMYRGNEHLLQYISGEEQLIDQWDSQLNGRSSVCMINAICPLGNNYINNRKATIQTIQTSGNTASFCSGTLVNNTANTPENCKPLLLTAAHCEASGSLDTSAFSQILVRFNFERTTCDNSGTTNGLTMTGVRVRARSHLISTSVSQINGDFMVYELRQAVPEHYNAVLSGWNRSNTITQSLTSPKQFTGFHHPGGDNKKLSVSQDVSSRNGTGGGANANGNRWRVNITSGYVAGGSSGSGLFDGDGYLIGIASTAGEMNPPASCQVSGNGATVQAMSRINYQKLWHAWEYNVDGTADNRRVKPWLDPLNSGVMQLGAVTAQCTPISEAPVSIHNAGNDLDKAIELYPNPSTDGKFSIQCNLKEQGDLQVVLMDINGRIIKAQKFTNVKSGVMPVSAGALQSGLYLVKISSANAYTVKKLIVQ